MSKQNEIVNILMRRDSLSENEAIEIFNDAVETAFEFGIEDALDELGLELDYAEELIFAMSSEVV